MDFAVFLCRPYLHWLLSAKYRFLVISAVLRSPLLINGSTSVYFGMTTGLTMPFFTRQMCEPVVLSCLKPSFSKMHFSTRQCSGVRRGIPRLGDYEGNGYAKPVRLLFGGVFRPAGCRRRVESGLAQDYFDRSSL